MFKKDDILINDDRDTLIMFYEENRDDKDCFVGEVIESTYYDKGELDDIWLLDNFETATKENTPKKWHEHLLNKFDRETVYFLNKEDVQVLHKKLKQEEK